MKVVEVVAATPTTKRLSDSVGIIGENPIPEYYSRNISPKGGVAQGT